MSETDEVKSSNYTVREAINFLKDFNIPVYMAEYAASIPARPSGDGYCELDKACCLNPHHTDNYNPFTSLTFAGIYGEATINVTRHNPISGNTVFSHVYLYFSFPFNLGMIETRFRKYFDAYLDSLPKRCLSCSTSDNNIDVHNMCDDILTRIHQRLVDYRMNRLAHLYRDYDSNNNFVNITRKDDNSYDVQIGIAFSRMCGINARELSRTRICIECVESVRNAFNIVLSDLTNTISSDDNFNAERRNLEKRLSELFQSSGFGRSMPITLHGALSSYTFVLDNMESYTSGLHNRHNNRYFIAKVNVTIPLSYSSPIINQFWDVITCHSDGLELMKYDRVMVRNQHVAEFVVSIQNRIEQYVQNRAHKQWPYLSVEAMGGRTSIRLTRNEENCPTLNVELHITNLLSDKSNEVATDLYGC